MAALTLILLLPYFFWGLYTLHRRFRYQEEFSDGVELLTLLGVLLIFVLESYLARQWMHHHLVAYFFGLLGFIVSAFALYGHMGVALCSRVLVDLVSAGEDTAPDRPRFSGAEMLERQGDYAGAYQEYLILARIFPLHPAVLQRMAEALVMLDRPTEALDCFERAFAAAKSPEEAEAPALRYDDLCSDQLKKPESGGRLMAAFLERFPESEAGERIARRLDRKTADTPEEAHETLIALEAAPLDKSLAAPEAEGKAEEEETALMPLLPPKQETMPLNEPREEDPPSAASLSLESLDQIQLPGTPPPEGEAEEGGEAAAPKQEESGLDPL